MRYRVYIDAKQCYEVEAINESAAKRIVEYTCEVKARFVEEIGNDTNNSDIMKLFEVRKVEK